MISRRRTERKTHRLLAVVTDSAATSSDHLSGCTTFTHFGVRGFMRRVLS